MRTYLFVYLGSALIALIITPVIIWVTRRLSITDVPGMRYMHSKPVPNIGGVAIFLSTMCVTVGVLFLSNAIEDTIREILPEIIVLLFATSFIFCIGLIDDIRIEGVRARVKFLAQMTAAVAVCAVGIRIRAVAVADWLTLDFGWFSWPLTILWIVGITNAVNLSDGLDGLAAGISAVACGVIAIFSVYTGQTVMAVIMLAMLGSLTGFLFFNFNPAKIFMGECGSMFLGFTIASSSILCASKSSTVVSLALPGLALGIPIFDTLFSMLRRFLERRSMFAPDRSHFHHRLIDLGLKQRHVVIVAYFITLIAAGLGIVMMVTSNISSIIIFFITCLMFLLVFWAIGSLRLKDTLHALKTRFSIAHKEKEDMYYFERIQLKMRAARTFDSWWHAICEAADLFGFSRITIVEHGQGDKTPTQIWRRGGLRPEVHNALRVSIPIPHIHNMEQKFVLEIEVHIEDSLESIGRRVALFSRLVGENILPDEKPKSAQELFEKVADTQTFHTPVYLTFEDSLPDRKIRKFLNEVDKAVEAERSSSHSLGDKGVD